MCLNFGYLFFQHFNSQLTHTTLKSVVLWLHIVTCEARVLCTHASQVTICNHNTDNVLYSLYVSTFNQVF